MCEICGSFSIEWMHLCVLTLYTEQDVFFPSSHQHQLLMWRRWMMQDNFILIACWRIGKRSKCAVSSRSCMTIRVDWVNPVAPYVMYRWLLWTVCLCSFHLTLNELRVNPTLLLSHPWKRSSSLCAGGSVGLRTGLDRHGQPHLDQNQTQDITVCSKLLYCLCQLAK
jgi:hypothetical protein